MAKYRKIYNLKEDANTIKIIQKASLDKNSRYGYKMENGLVFGTTEWFEAIDNGTIPKHEINGTISRVYMSGHNDYPEFEIKNEESLTIWTIEGNIEAYKTGKSILLTFVEQKYKRPTDITGLTSKCIIEIDIEDTYSN